MWSWSHLKSIEFHGRDNCLWEVIFILCLEYHERVNWCARVCISTLSPARVAVLCERVEMSLISLWIFYVALSEAHVPRGQHAKSLKIMSWQIELRQTDGAITDGFTFIVSHYHKIQHVARLHHSDLFLPSFLFSLCASCCYCELFRDHYYFHHLHRWWWNELMSSEQQFVSVFNKI